MYAVVANHSYDVQTHVVLFEDHDKAKAYLHWLWEEFYNTCLANDDDVNEEFTYHEEEYAKVEWDNGDVAEFILAEVSSPLMKFEDVDYKRYL